METDHDVTVQLISPRNTPWTVVENVDILRVGDGQILWL